MDVLAAFVIILSSMVLVGFGNSGIKFKVQAAGEPVLNSDSLLSPGKMMIMECADGNPLTLNRLTNNKVRIRCGDGFVQGQMGY